MRLFFGKELKHPIHDAFVAIQTYFDSVFDLKESTWLDYKAKLGTNTLRNHTLYSITDQQYDTYSERLEIGDALIGGYVGSTEPRCAFMGNALMFENNE